MRGARGPLAAFAVLAGLLAARGASAATPVATAKGNERAEEPVLVLAVATEDGLGSLAKDPPDALDAPLLRAASELEGTLRESVQDLGFPLAVGRGEDKGAPRSDDALLAAAERSPDTWILAPRVTRAPRGQLRVELTAIAPHRLELRRRVVLAAPKDVLVQGLVLARDLLTREAPPCAPATDEDPPPQATPRSAGRPVLAATGALYGALAAYGIQRGSGSSDPRVTYPLLAIGTGTGLGAALLVAEEWDVRPADAWYLAGGAGWGATSGLLFANAGGKKALEERYSIAVGAGAAGLGLGALGLTAGHVREGGAAVAHSTAAYGLLFGGLGELAVRGKTTGTPRLGASIGVATGLLAGGVLAHVAPVSTNRVLLVDLSAGLGALGGAAVASPLVFGTVTPGRARLFLGATALGAVGGAVTGLYLTRGEAPTRRRGATFVPDAGALPLDAHPAYPATAYGLGAHGTF